MYGFPIIRRTAPRPPKHHGTAYRMYTSTSHRRLGLISWYTTGFQ